MQPPRRREVTLVSNEEVAPSVHVLTFRVEREDPLDFVPGQYVTFYLKRSGKQITRSYSIFSSAREHERFELLVKKVEGGFGSTLLCGLSPTTAPPLPVLAPLGRFLLQDPGDRTVIFVATGTGLAPFISMLESLRREHPCTSAWLFFGNRCVEDIVRKKELEDLQVAWPSFHFVPVISRPPKDGSWHGLEGHVQSHVQAVFPRLDGTDVYLCGVNEMVNDMQELAQQLGCPKSRIFLERYGESADEEDVPALPSTQASATP